MRRTARGGARYHTGQTDSRWAGDKRCMYRQEFLRLAGAEERPSSATVQDRETGCSPLLGEGRCMYTRCERQGKTSEVRSKRSPENQSPVESVSLFLIENDREETRACGTNSSAHLNTFTQQIT